jgi:hypothetical protein
VAASSFYADALSFFAAADRLRYLFLHCAIINGLPRLPARKVLVSPMPREGRTRQEEIRRQYLILPTDLREECMFALDFDMWDK